jgi:phosphoenolpyruvate carboxykinase (ATP)
MVYYETTEQLMDLAKENGTKTTKEGLLHFNTGKFTGRSPKDRYFANGEYVHDNIDFKRAINQKLSREEYISLKEEMKEYLEENKTLRSRRVAGYSYEHMATFSITSTEPWAIIFFNNMLIDPSSFVTTYSRSFTEWEVLHAPNFVSKNRPEGVKNENFVIIDFDDRKILIAGTSYTGEIKKSVFTVLNTLLIDRGVLPMHCSANSNTKDGIGVNLFFGLSGTGKTTLSSDPLKFFIGDDEHGWDGNKIFNFEGGCYAKLIDLEEEKEPIIWNAIHSKFTRQNTSLLENIIVDEDGNPDFTDSSITENIRVSYPLDQISRTSKVTMTGRGNDVKNIFFLSFDAFGVLPPISLLNTEQAVKYFELGYTSKVAGTEVGINEPTTTFSPCFGNPFLPRKISDYTNLFREKLMEFSDVKVWLVNTGFDKDYNRFSLSQTRGVINGVIDGDYDDTFIEYNELQIPKRIGEYNMEEVFEKPDEIRQGKFFTMIKNSL